MPANPPRYTILRRGYPDGREDFRVRINRFGWLREWKEDMIGDGGYDAVAVYRTREQAHKAANAHWESWLSRQPAMMHESYDFDPEAMS